MKKLSLILFFLLPYLLVAQGITESDKLNFQKRVKDFDDFIRVFNKVKSVPDKEKAGTISTLFDKDYFKTNEKESFEFMKEVVAKNSSLKTEDSLYFVEVNYQVLYKGRPEKLTLIYEQEFKKSNKSSKWVIKSVDANFLKVLKIDSTAFIPPNADATHFLAMQEMQDTPNIYASYAHKKYQPDALTLFFYFLQNKELVIEKAITQKYHLLQLSGWLLVLSEFNRDTENSGLLVSQCSKITADAKNAHLKKYGIR